MNFKIRLGIPDILDFWKDLCERRKKQELSKNEITIISIEPHPEDRKRSSYDRINLSALPKN